MKARCKTAVINTTDPECPLRYLDLTVGKVYRVYAIEEDHFRLVGDDGYPFLYPSHAFQIVDPAPGTGWVKMVDEDGETTFGPPGLYEPDLIEDYFECVKEAGEKVKRYIPKAKWPRWP